MRCLGAQCEAGQLLVDVFVNYDCDLEGANLYERLVLALVRLAQGTADKDANPSAAAALEEQAIRLSVPPPICCDCLLVGAVADATFCCPLIGFRVCMSGMTCMSVHIMHCYRHQYSAMIPLLSPFQRLYCYWQDHSRGLKPASVHYSCFTSPVLLICMT